MINLELLARSVSIANCAKTFKGAIDMACKEESDIIRFQAITGHTINEVAELFMAGYTLTPPKESLPLRRPNIFKQIVIFLKRQWERM